MEKKGNVRAVLHKDSTAADVLQSFFHALVMANLTERSNSLHLESQSWMDKQYEVFIQKVHLWGSFGKEFCCGFFVRIVIRSN